MRGIFGRPAARDAKFLYSDELKRSRLVWDEATLDQWLADPDKLVPGNDMGFRIASASERADIIAFLKTVPSQ
jgi:cytochrome c